MKQTRNRCRYRHRMQCTRRACQKRRTVTKDPRLMKRWPTCLVCGARMRDVEKYRRAELAKQERCYCSAFPFPHRKGSLRFCHAHPLAAVPPTLDEFEQYEGILATDRSG